MIIIQFVMPVPIIHLAHAPTRLLRLSSALFDPFTMILPCTLEKIQRKSVLAVINVSIVVHLWYQAIDDINNITNLQKNFMKHFLSLV